MGVWGRDADDHRRPCLFLDAIFRSSYPWASTLDFLPDNGARLQMADLVLFAYVAAAFLSHPNWSAVLRATFIPHVEWSKDYISVLVGILGTTISPYLFFWQAAQEVEEIATTERTQSPKERVPRTKNSAWRREM